MSYEQYLQENFFRPLGMSATHSCVSRPPGEHFARGYIPGEGGFAPAPPVNMNTAVGDGGLCSSVLDLVTWTRALTTGHAVSKTSYGRMVTPERVRRGYRPGYGYGLSLVRLDGRRRVGHNGDITGFMSALAHYPKDNLTVAVLTNRARHWPEVIERDVARKALGLPTPVVKDLPLDRERLRAYAGTYDFGVYPLHVREEAGRLRTYTGVGQAALYPPLPGRPHFRRAGRTGRDTADVLTTRRPRGQTPVPDGVHTLVRRARLITLGPFRYELRAPDG